MTIPSLRNLRPTTAPIALVSLTFVATGCGTATPEEPQDLCLGSVPASSPSPEQAASPNVQRLDGDEYADLVIAYPGQEGSVLVVPGGEDGPDSEGAQTVAPGENGIPDSPKDDARFGGDPRLGDFDGDGRTDIAVAGGPESESDDAPGSTVLAWGGEEGVKGGSVLQWTDGENPGVNAVGDFDGDGVSDMLVGAEWFGDPPQVLYGPFDRDGEPARTAASGVALGDQETSFAVGDVDGDECDDLLVFHAFEEMAYDTAVWAADGDGFTEAGSVAAADEGLVADVDGDGYGDVVVHETGATVEEGPWTPGRVSVYPGGPDGPASEPQAELTLDSAGMSRTSEDGDHFGRVLAAGDVNADGYADVAASVNRPVTGGTPVDEGDVVVLPGGPDGLTGEGACLLRPEDADRYPQRSGPAPGDGYWDEYDETPRTLLRLLDTDGDGADDVAVGAPSADDAADGGAPGPVRVYRGLHEEDGALVPGSAQGVGLPHRGEGSRQFGM
ncbi:FG-GAP repeat domain-containing protein [Nocardiopsis halophila]|uniref:FG-GAP repeat domain-containing protein n=1 Tax=Nocardiopsis halophila TaxID=141692 RepID=UPI00036C643D|nr:VCBS repeat-containing protein [Nocardiopsis halophila]